MPAAVFPAVVVLRVIPGAVFVIDAHAAFADDFDAAAVGEVFIFGHGFKLPGGGVKEIQLVGRQGVAADYAHGDVGMAVAVVVAYGRQIVGFAFDKAGKDGEVFNSLHLAGFFIGDFHLIAVFGKDFGFDGKGKAFGRGHGAGFGRIGGERREGGGQEQGRDEVFHRVLSGWAFQTAV